RRRPKKHTKPPLRSFGGNFMSTNPETILPLPKAEYRLSPDGKPCLHDSETLADYARACVSSATEALRAERDAYKAADESMQQAHYEACVRERAAEARAERLAEA